MEKRLKAVCSGYYGFGNFGDDAVLKVLVGMFSKKYDLTILSSNPQNTSNQYNVKSIYSFSYIDVIETIKASDVLISGGGSLLQDVTSFKSLLYYLLLIFFASLFKKKIIIFAQGLGPFKSPMSLILVKAALSRCELITVRDSDSSSLLTNWGLSHVVVADPVYNLMINNVPKNGKLGIQLRNFSNLGQEFLDELAMAINNYYSDYDVVLYSLQDSIDLQLCNSFAKQLRHKNIEIKSSMPIEETISELSSLSLMIAMRFHAVLIGLKAGVKVLPIAYDKKVSQLANEVNIEYLNMSNDDVAKKVEGLASFSFEHVKDVLNSKFLDESIFDI